MSVMCFNGMHYNRIRIRITFAPVSTRRISIVVHFSYVVLYGLHFGRRQWRSAQTWDCSFVKRYLNINCLACTQIGATVKTLTAAVAIDWLWQMATNPLEFIAAKPARWGHIQRPILSNIRKYNIIQFIRKILMRNKIQISIAEHRKQFYMLDCTKFSDMFIQAIEEQRVCLLTSVKLFALVPSFRP